MNLLNRISIKNFLFCIVGLLVAALVLQSLFNFLNIKTQSHEIRRISLANDLSDHIISAAGYQAIERGVTSAALSQQSSTKSLAFKAKINSLRKQSAADLDEAFTLTAELIKIDSSNSALKRVADKVQRTYAELQTARTKVDSELARNTKGLTTSDWIKTITTFISANADLRLTAMTSPAVKETLQHALRMNIEIRQAVWLMSEYAGRERATLAGYIGNGKSLDPAARERLNAFRAIVELNTAPVIALKGAYGTSPAVTTSIEKMEQVFLARFNTVRDSIYAGADTGVYPISASEWLTQSTTAINSILEVSGSIGTMVDGMIATELAAANRAKITALATLAGVLVLGLFAFWVIKNKVIRPMHALNGSMSDIARTGDLVNRLEIQSSDEIGEVSKAFNTMLDKFHNIVTDIHQSADKLVSSSEELSASSVQIAGGTREQGEKALQISAASQEMSATIIEITQNISNASNSATAASTVASTGGQTVEETISSMREISESAQNSSSIITNLGTKSEQIGDIVEVINDIADQTNLLALNAAIEAARAGEQGRGFAVVADEVRKLAEKTMKATKEIGDMINGMQSETKKAIASAENEVKVVEGGVNLASQAGESLVEILDKVNIVSEMVQQVSVAAIEQTATTEQITTDIEGISTVINDTSTSAEQVAGASHEIAQLAAGLKVKIGMFKIAPANNPSVLRLAERIEAGEKPATLGKAAGY